MKIEDTYTATIWVGYKERYDGTLHTYDEAKSICQGYVDAVGLCVTMTETEFVYTKGSEKGLAIGLINYPRFPDRKAGILEKAMKLGYMLMYAFNQYKVTIVTPNKTYMLENEELDG